MSLLDTIADIPAALWDRVVGDDHPGLSHRYLAAVEGPHRYGLVYQDRHLVAVACFALDQINLDLFLPTDSRLRALIGRIRAWWPRFLAPRVLECGPPGASGPGLCMVAGLTEGQRARIRAALVRTAGELACLHGARLTVLRDFREPQGFERLGYRAVPNLQETEIDIRWTSFDQYLGAMRSGYRRAIQRDLDRLAGLRQETTEDFRRHADRMAQLWRQTNQRPHGYDREQLDARYFRALPDGTVAMLFWQDRTLVAFTVSLVGGRTLVPLWLGVDYSVDAPLVFGCYYGAVGLAIQRGLTRVLMGDTTYEVKLRLGARLVDQTMYCRLPGLTWLLAWAARRTTPVSRERRNVFKTTADPGRR